MITFSVMAACIMQALDTTIANIAMPRMQGTLSGTQDQMVWVLTSYLVASAIMTPLAGWLALRIGRKRLVLFSVIGFTVASALCGAAESLTQIVLFRALQGVCGASLMPLSQSILLDINPKERHARAMALWGMGVVLGPIMGPMLGGWLTEDYNWRWVFYINVPIGILAALGVIAYLPETARKRVRFDMFGFVMLSLGIGALQLMLDRGELEDWFSSTEICVEGLIAALALYFFGIHMFTSERPFVNRALFHDRNFVIGNLFVFMFGLVLFATMALLPPIMQGLLGYPVLLAGLITAPRGLGLMAAMVVVGRLAGRVDARWMVGVGLALCAMALAQMAGVSPQTGEAPWIVSGVIQGLGTGLAWASVTNIGFATLSPALRNEGTSLFNLTRNVGSTVGISLMQAYVSSGSRIANAQLVQYVNPYGLQIHQPQVSAQLATAAGTAALSSSIATQASWIAYLDAFRLMTIVTLLALPVLLLVRGAKAKRGGSEVVVE